MEELSTKNNSGPVNDKTNEALYYLNFLIWPFGLTLASLKRWNRPWSKNIFWLFCIFFGFTFIIAKEGGADSDRYAQLFKQYALTNPSLKALLSSFYAESSNFVDIAQPLITYIVSRFTHNPSVLFAVFGMIFGYFYSRNIWYVIEKFKGNFTPIIILYFLTFILINPIWNINAFRMWTAAQIFLFGALPYLFEKKSKMLIWSAVAVIFHFSFLFPLAILTSFVFIKNRLNIFFFFFVIASFIHELNLQSLQSALSFFPAVFQSRIGSYTDADYAEFIRLQNQSINWYVIFSSKALTYVTYLMVIFIYSFYRSILYERKELMTLSCFSLYLYGWANIASLVPSGDRFVVVANSFVFIFLILFISGSPKDNVFYLPKILSIPLLVIFCIVTLRIGMDYFGLMTIFGNPILALIDSNYVPIIEGIKGLF